MAGYQALAGLARGVSPTALVSVADRARRDCDELPETDRLQIAAALAPEQTIYGPPERAGRLAEDLGAAFHLRKRIGHGSLERGETRVVLAAAPDLERMQAVQLLLSNLDALHDYYVEEVVGSLAPYVSAAERERLASRAERLEAAQGAAALAALRCDLPADRSLAADPEREFAALSKDVYRVWAPDSLRLAAAKSYWGRLPERQRLAEVAGLFSPSESLGKGPFLRRLANLSFAVGDVVDEPVLVDLLDIVQGILHEIG